MNQEKNKIQEEAGKGPNKKVICQNIIHSAAKSLLIAIHCVLRLAISFSGNLRQLMCD